MIGAPFTVGEYAHPISTLHTVVVPVLGLPEIDLLGFETIERIRKVPYFRPANIIRERKGRQMPNEKINNAYPLRGEHPAQLDDLVRMPGKGNELRCSPAVVTKAIELPKQAQGALLDYWPTARDNPEAFFAQCEADILADYEAARQESPMPHTSKWEPVLLSKSLCHTRVQELGLADEGNEQFGVKPIDYANQSVGRMSMTFPGAALKTRQQIRKYLLLFGKHEFDDFVMPVEVSTPTFPDPKKMERVDIAPFGGGGVAQFLNGDTPDFPTSHFITVPIWVHVNIGGKPYKFLRPHLFQYAEVPEGKQGLLYYGTEYWKEKRRLDFLNKLIERVNMEPESGMHIEHAPDVDDRDGHLADAPASSSLLELPGVADEEMEVDEDQPLSYAESTTGMSDREDVSIHLSEDRTDDQQGYTRASESVPAAPCQANSRRSSSLDIAAAASSLPGSSSAAQVIGRHLRQTSRQADTTAPAETANMPGQSRTAANRLPAIPKNDDPANERIQIFQQYNLNANFSSYRLSKTLETLGAASAVTMESIFKGSNVMRNQIAGKLNRVMMGLKEGEVIYSPRPLETGQSNPLYSAHNRLDGEGVFGILRPISTRPTIQPYSSDNQLEETGVYGMLQTNWMVQPVSGEKTNPLYLPDKEFRFLPHIVRDQLDIEALPDNLPRWFIKETAERNNMLIQVLGTKLLNQYDLKKYFVIKKNKKEREVISPSFAKEFNTLMRLKKEEGKKEGKTKLEIGKTRMDMPWAEDDVMFVSKQLWEHGLPHHQIEWSIRARAHPRPKVGGADDAFIGRLIRIVDLNGKNPWAMSKMFGMERAYFYSKYRAGLKYPISNDAARTIALKFAEMAAAEDVSYEDKEPAWAGTLSKKKLRWPSEDFRVLPHPVYDENDPLFDDDDDDVRRLAMYNIFKNCNFKAKHFFEMHGSLVMKHHFFGSNKKEMTDEITDEMAKRFDQFIADIRNKDSSKVIDDGRTRMQMPEAADDVIFLGKDFAGLSAL